MILLIDAGNSRIKWGIYEAGQWQEKSAVPTADMASLEGHWRDLRPDCVLVSNVTGENFAGLLERIFAPRASLVCLVPEVEAHGMRNHYSPPASLGADRYAALIAAQRHGLGNVIVASLGTALTVDALTAEGDFLGGLILPGYRTMLHSIEQSTHGVRTGLGQREVFPTSTKDAVESGILAALVGAIEAQRKYLEIRAGAAVTVLLTGGDANLIRPLLQEPMRVAEDMVLEGLLWVAREKGVVVD